MRQFLDDATQAPDWTTIGSVALEVAIYIEVQTYDALGRTLSITTPEGAVTTYTYDLSGVMFGLSVAGVHSLSTDIINEVYYNAFGQRIKVKYENGATTTMEYDPITYRVTRIRTTRSSDSAELQDLKYWYDPVGNITLQKDAAQQDVYYDNTVASPTNNYTYDALYRLILAKGREHAGGNAPVSYNDGTRIGKNPLPTDAAAMRRYRQYYTYDEVGNMLQMRHTTSGGTGNWTKDFDIDPASNRLTSSSIGSNTTGTETYTYDARGNMVDGMNHITSMVYNDLNMLAKVIDASGLITTYYQYDYQGQRARKYIVDTNTNLHYNKKYFGYWELYQKVDSGTNVVILERETLRLTDGGVNCALIETPTIDTASTGEVQLLRYQFSNHLSTASLELDEDAAIISFEEYYPYGDTSYQGGRSAAECSLKRYRFTGKEKDGETGFYYHGARYYIPWLARWVAADPMESKFSPESPYNYGHNNPITWNDPDGMQAQLSTGNSDNFVPIEGSKFEWPFPVDNDEIRKFQDGFYSEDGEDGEDGKDGKDGDGTAINISTNNDNGTTTYIHETTTSTEGGGSETNGYAIVVDNATLQELAFWAYNNTTYGSGGNPLKNTNTQPEATSQNSDLGGQALEFSEHFMNQVDAFGTGLEKTGMTQIGNNGTLYFETEAGRVFRGNQYVNTNSLVGIGEKIGKKVVIVGLSIDLLQIGAGVAEDNGTFGTHAQTETIGAIGGATGGWLGGELGFFAGAIIGAVVVGLFMPALTIAAGIAIFGFVGALIGGAVGAEKGSTYAKSKAPGILNSLKNFFSSFSN